MTRWERSPHDCACGGCGAPMREGDPRLIILPPVVPPKDGVPLDPATMKAQSAPKVRCPRCAGEPMPANLPPLLGHTRPPIAPIPKQSTIERRPLFALAERWRGRDGKAAAIGREPGEDDL